MASLIQGHDLGKLQEMVRDRSLGMLQFIGSQS